MQQRNNDQSTTMCSQQMNNVPPNGNGNGNNATGTNARTCNNAVTNHLTNESITTPNNSTTIINNNKQQSLKRME
jgi:hypothetical protein